VTLIQRFGSALNLNVHFHMLLPDGVYKAVICYTFQGEAAFLDLGERCREQLG
jgi:hypothetical protein